MGMLYEMMNKMVSSIVCNMVRRCKQVNITKFQDTPKQRQNIPKTCPQKQSQHITPNPHISINF
jgi:hypothetical protein